MKVYKFEHLPGDILKKGFKVIKHYCGTSNLFGNCLENCGELVVEFWEMYWKFVGISATLAQIKVLGIIG